MNCYKCSEPIFLNSYIYEMVSMDASCTNVMLFKNVLPMYIYGRMYLPHIYYPMELFVNEYMCGMHECFQVLNNMNNVNYGHSIEYLRL